MIEHQEVPGVINVDLGSSLNMQTLYDSIPAPSTSTTVVGISIPLINVNCLQFPTIDPVADIRDAISKLYNYAVKAWLEPIWTLIRSLFSALSRFGLGILDENLGILDLTIADIFDDANQLYDKILAYATNLYHTALDDLKNLLSTLGIPWPLFGGTFDPVADIVYIVKAICYSIWGIVLKLIKKAFDAIRAVLAAVDFYYNPTVPTWQELWDKAYTSIMYQIATFLVIPVTMQDIWNALKNLGNTAEEILNNIKNFTFSIFGKPFDWLFPLNLHVNAPTLDLMHILADILVWISNFLFNIIYKFIQAIYALFELFGIAGNWLTSIPVPITLCVVPKPGSNTVPTVPKP
jgi:hypothetical protein